MKHVAHNIRIGWKGLPGTNTLDYYENPYFYGRNFFIGLALASSNSTYKKIHDDIIDDIIMI